MVYNNRIPFIHSYKHSHSDWGINHTKQQPARLPQLAGLGVFFKDTSTR